VQDPTAPSGATDRTDDQHPTDAEVDGPRPHESEADADAAIDRELKVCERQLRRAGMPTLIADYTAADDIFTRAAPVLILVAFLEVLGALNHEWTWYANVAALFGGIALFLVLFGVANRLRGRPFLALPRRVDRGDLAGFVLLPAVLPLVFGGQVGSAALTALGNLALVGLVWLVVGFGLLSIVRWAGARLFSQLAASLKLLERALPLILFFGLLSFFTTEIWQLFSTVSTPRYVALVILFVLVGLTFLTARLPSAVRDVGVGVHVGAPLSTVQRVNIAMIVLISQVLQILLVTALVWLFFAVAGALLVDLTVVQSWTGEVPDTFWDITLFDQHLVVTRQLLRATFGIAAFSGLYYTVGMLVDPTFGRDFVTELRDQMESTFATRARYLRLRTTQATGSSTPSSGDGGGEAGGRPA
jgi:hypothetical protein